MALANTEFFTFQASYIEFQLHFQKNRCRIPVGPPTVNWHTGARAPVSAAMTDSTDKCLTLNLSLLPLLMVYHILVLI